MINRSLPLKWHGGKQKLAKWILSYMPEHTHRVITHGGGLGMFLQSDPTGVSEVVNDLDKSLINFWKVLRDKEGFAELRRFAEATPVCEATWNECQRILEGWKASSRPDPMAAWAMLVLVRQSRQGLRDSFCTLSKTRTRRDRNEQASAWLGAIEGLSDAHDRLSRVVIRSKDAIEIIKSEDSKHTWFYLDPPYLHETRVTTEDYAHEMTEEQHLDLLDALANISGKFCLSGYPSDLYNRAAEICGWTMVSKQAANHASGSSKKPQKQECLWMNYTKE